MSKNIGMQIFSVYRQYLEAPEETLRGVAQAGYTGVELAGYAGLRPERLRKLLDELGMDCFSMHVPYDRLEGALELEANAALQLGCRYVVCPRVDPEHLRTREGIRETARTLGQFGDALASHGLTFCLHNHQTELMRVEGQIVLDALLEGNGSGSVHLEWDAFWALFADTDADAYIRKHIAACPLYNLKDYVRLPKRPLPKDASPVERAVDALSGQETIRHVALGRGEAHMAEVLAFAVASPAVDWLIIEPVLTDGNPFDCLRESLQWVRSRL